ncbi:urotensin-2 isoform X1 [Suricata suricatta]|uniref:urotensin-2 isoform X1 n=1 Tax=Suricata suricatta TaxID=37032 RepID=UPI001155B391|nr:urotensin-2 isoform X1 [Suricata suricatta]
MNSFRNEGRTIEMNEEQVESSEQQKPRRRTWLSASMHKLVSCCLLLIGCLQPLFALPVPDSGEDALKFSAPDGDARSTPGDLERVSLLQMLATLVAERGDSLRKAGLGTGLANPRGSMRQHLHNGPGASSHRQTCEKCRLSYQIEISTFTRTRGDSHTQSCLGVTAVSQLRGRMTWSEHGGGLWVGESRQGRWDAAERRGWPTVTVARNG